MSHPVGKPHPGQQFLGALLRLLTWHPGRPQWHHDVFQRGQAGDQIERLEHDAHGVASIFRQCARVECGHVNIAEFDTSGRRAQNSAQAGQQGCLTASAGPQQNCQRSGGYVQTQLVDRAHGLLAAGVLHHEVFDT